jgi:hypothetical protein
MPVLDVAFIVLIDFLFIDLLGSMLLFVLELEDFIFGFPFVYLSVLLPENFAYFMGLVFLLFVDLLVHMETLRVVLFLYYSYLLLFLPFALFDNFPVVVFALEPFLLLLF